MEVWESLEVIKVCFNASALPSKCVTGDVILVQVFNGTSPGKYETTVSRAPADHVHSYSWWLGYMRVCNYVCFIKSL